MPKASADFDIHVDDCCMSPTEPENSLERQTSEETTIHHDISAESMEAEGREHEHDEIQNDEDKNNHTHERRRERMEEEIKAAARTVVENLEKHKAFQRHQDSELSMQTDESYDGAESHNGETDYTHDDGTELTYDGTEGTFETEMHSDRGDGEADDDVFSRASRNSHRSSLNSSQGHHHMSEEAEQEKALPSPVVGEEANSTSQAISRLPSGISSVMLQSQSPGTPTRSHLRTAFHSSSSVRALQMSSPAASLYSSPRSARRDRHQYHPTVSRLGTPTSPRSATSRTPTRFKKEYPLELLHTTVLPVQWSYAAALLSPELPVSLQSVKESYRLLQEKLGELVLTRGILIAHPQDSYEVLEERLLEALELPVRPRAKILKCGHYMGPSDDEGSNDDSDSGIVRSDSARSWCDVCGRPVRYEVVEPGAGERRFRVKIFASNGLMTAGAWAAVWQQMEKIDVEIEPYVDSHLIEDLDMLAGQYHHSASHHEDGFVDTEPMESIEHHDGEEAREMHEREMQEHEEARMHEEENRRLDEEAQMMHDEENRKLDEEARQIHEAEKMAEDRAMREHILAEEQHRQLYELHQEETKEEERPQTATSPATSPSRGRRQEKRTQVHGDSLPELLLAAAKLAIQDTKNVVICVLSFFVLLLALRPRAMVDMDGLRNPMESVSANHIEYMTPALDEAPVVVVEPTSQLSCAAPVVEESPKVVVEESQQEQAACAMPQVEQPAAPVVPKVPQASCAQVVELPETKPDEPAIDASKLSENDEEAMAFSLPQDSLSDHHNLENTHLPPPDVEL